MAQTRPSFRKRFMLGWVLVLALGTGGVVWMSRHSPPDPVHNGQKLSWRVHQTLGPQGGLIAMQAAKTTLAAIEATKPDSILWLAYTAEHGGVGRDPSPGELTRRWSGLVEMARVKLRVRDSAHDGDDALGLLVQIGPEAAPAIPALVRAVDRANEHSYTDNRRAVGAIRVLNRIGPAARATYLDLLATRPPHIRALLAGGRRQLLEEVAVPDTEYTEILGELVRASCDPDARVRYAAVEGVAMCGYQRGFSPAMEPALPAAIELLSEPNVLGRPTALSVLAAFGQRSKTTIPRLLELLDHQNPHVMEAAALALAQIAPVDTRFAPRLRTILESGDPERQQAARQLLRRIGQPVEEGR